MANTTTQQIIFDSPREAVIKWWLASDGSSGELSKLNLSTISSLAKLADGGSAPTQLGIIRVDWAFVGFDGYLEWDATTDVPILALPGGYASKVKFDDERYGPGILPNTKASGYTGDILLSTSGFSAATDRGHIILHLRKA